MFQLFGARLFEAEDLAALRIDSGHDVADGAASAGAVHSLKDQQQRITVGGVVKLLQRAQLRNARSRDSYLLDGHTGFTAVGHSLSLTFFPDCTRKSFALIVIFPLSVPLAAWVALAPGTSTPPSDVPRIASNLALRLKPVLVLLAFAPRSLLVEFVSA